VCFIDDDHFYIEVEQELKAVEVIELFGSDEEDFEVTTFGADACEVVIIFGLIGVDAGSANAEALFELSDLIAHQREQWRDDEGEAIKHRGGELIEEGFTRARGLEAEQATFYKECFNGFTLSWTKGVKAEHVVKLCIDLGEELLCILSHRGFCKI